MSDAPVSKALLSAIQTLQDIPSQPRRDPDLFEGLTHEEVLTLLVQALQRRSALLQGIALDLDEFSRAALRGSSPEPERGQKLGKASDHLEEAVLHLRRAEGSLHEAKARVQQAFRLYGEVYPDPATAP